MADPRNDPVLALFHDVASAVGRSLRDVTDWGQSGVRAGQYVADLGADAVAVETLVGAGFSVLSEESGWSGRSDADDVVVVDPLDGSTNASRGIPWFATALCLVDGAGPRVSLVADQASGQRFWAVRDGGAWSSSTTAGPRALSPSGCRQPEGALIGISGRPEGDYGWWQFRALGAVALDLCLVASGTLDGFVDMSPDAHGVWDYLAGALICQEAGARVLDALGRDLVALDHEARRTPVAAATPELLERLLAVRTP